MRQDAEAARLWIRRHIADLVKGVERTGRSLDEPLQGLGPLEEE